MGLMGFKTTFSWSGNTSQSRCCTTFVRYVKNLLRVYVHLGMWKPWCWCSRCCGSVTKPLCTKRFMISSNYCKDWTVALWQKRLEWNDADLGMRRACSWKCRPARRAIPQRLFSWKQRLRRTYHSGESGRFCGRPQAEQRARWMCGWVLAAFDHPWYTSRIPLASASAKSSMEKLALWTCGQQRRRREM